MSFQNTSLNERKIIAEESSLYVWDLLNSKERGFYCFEKNYEDLVECYETQKIPNKTVKIGENSQLKMSSNMSSFEIIRCWLNFLSTAIMLVDQTRRIRNEIEKMKADDFILEYDDIIENNFLKDPLHIFIKDLRHMILHVKFPSSLNMTGVVTKVKENEYLSEYTGPKITRNILSEYSKWNKLSKEYILNYTDKYGDICFLDISNKYYHKVKNLHLFVYKFLANLHKMVTKDIKQY